jgi:hypothetical protein
MNKTTLENFTANEFRKEIESLNFFLPVICSPFKDMPNPLRPYTPHPLEYREYSKVPVYHHSR